MTSDSRQEDVVKLVDFDSKTDLGSWKNCRVRVIIQIQFAVTLCIKCAKALEKTMAVLAVVDEAVFKDVMRSYLRIR